MEGECQLQSNNLSPPDHPAHRPQDRGVRHEFRLGAFPRLAVLAPEARVVAHARGLAFDRAALRRAEALLRAAVPFVREHSREEVARTGRRAASEQSAPGQHGGGLAEAAAVQQCSRDSGRGQWRSARDLTRLEIDQNCQPLHHSRTNARTMRDLPASPPSWANPHGLLRWQRLAGRTTERVVEVICTDGSRAGRAPH